MTLLGRQGGTCSGCWCAAACCWLTITLARLAEALDATELLRSVLEGAADRSVTVVSVGYMTNLLGLLQARVPPTVSASPELYTLTLPLPPSSTLLALLRTRWAVGRAQAFLLTLPLPPSSPLTPSSEGGRWRVGPKLPHSRCPSAPHASPASQSEMGGVSGPRSPPHAAPPPSCPLLSERGERRVGP